MNRGFLQGAAALAFLGAAAACSGGGQKETGMLKSDSAVPGTDAPLWSLRSFQSGGIVALPDSGQGSGGHLIARVVCHYDAATGMLTCTGLAGTDSGHGSGGHRVALLMDCASKGPATELVCTAPLGTPR